MSNYSIGNSLTDDGAVRYMPGWGYHLRGGVTLPVMYNDPNSVDDTFSPDRWPAAFAATQYDYFSLQPYQGTAELNASYITQWAAIQTDGVIVIHDHPASRDGWETQYHATSGGSYSTHSKQQADATRSLVADQNPGRTIRETNCADCMEAIYHDIANAPFAWADLYRDVTHLSLDRGRFLLNNLFRAAFRLPYITAEDFLTLTGFGPDAASEAYLLDFANQYTPGFFTYTGGGSMLAYGYGNSGADYDFFALNSANEVWDNVASEWVSWVDGDFVNYRIAATEIGTSGRFTATVPDDTAVYEMRLRGASLAASFVLWVAEASTAIDGASLAADLLAEGVASQASVDDLHDDVLLVVEKTKDIGDGAAILANDGFLPGKGMVLVAGDSFDHNLSLGFDVTDAAQITLTAKVRETDEDTDALLQVKMDGGLTVLDGAAPPVGATGLIELVPGEGEKIKVYLSPAVSRALENMDPAPFDVQVVFSETEVRTAFLRDLSVRQDVTKEVT